MNDIWNFQSEDFPFELFSASHIIAVILMVCLIFLLFFYRKRLSDVGRGVVKWGLVTVLMIGEIYFQLWYVINGAWSLTVNLPLQLCSISLYLCIFMLLFKNQFIFECAFFSSMTGSFVAMITPELFFGYPHIRFFQFFSIHAAIVLSCLYMVWVEGFTVRFSTVIKSFLALNVIAAMVYVVDRILDANYMFLVRKPVNPGLIDYLGEYPWYLLSLEGITFFLFIILYIVFKLERKWN
ncbi:TIGR02206 family membrane protein [Rossellomorea aquimaris]|uniref:YwaF family protein n=1 Tax=Rossellomorea aquimaris TaxID=189382 RepID=UPI001CD4819A|nr:TIGR02206 family membrane protein [Rossellomorea aquimaris]MCA1053680.1 TIGR02206 family membrane protein [Rossellomorea aquimaris]